MIIRDHKKDVAYTLYLIPTQRTVSASLPIDYKLASRRSVKKALRLASMSKPTRARTQPLIYMMMVRKVDDNIEITPSNVVQQKKDLPLVDDPDLRKLIHRYQKVFRDSLPENLPPQRDVEHAIETGDAKPVNINAYPLSKTHMDEQVKPVTDLLDKELIWDSASPWGFPVLFVKKPVGWRMCIDYRALNAVTEKNGYPLPRIQECLDRLGTSVYLTKIDLTSGYWQIRVKEDHIPKMAFNTRYGKFEFTAMPFGLTNAPATFQSMMNNILRPYLDKFAIVYLDDIVIYSKTKEEYLEHVEKVLKALSDHRLYAKLV